MILAEVVVLGYAAESNLAQEHTVLKQCYLLPEEDRIVKVLVRIDLAAVQMKVEVHNCLPQKIEV